MQVDIRSREIAVDEVLRAHVDRRLRLSFGRFGEIVAKVLVRLEDTDSQNRGVDKRCQIYVALRPSGDVLVEAVDANYRDAVNRAIDRAARAIDLDLQRRRDAG